MKNNNDKMTKKWDTPKLNTLTIFNTRGGVEGTVEGDDPKGPSEA